MSLGRALRAVPLAAAVAVLVHVAVFGWSHAPGAGHAPELLGSLGLALGLGLAGAFASGLLGTGRSVATSAPCRYSPMLLIFAGAATFGLIELGEGHILLGALLRGTLAAIPVAYAVSFAAAALAGAAKRAGAACAALVGIVGRRARSGAALASRTRPQLAFAPAPALRRGRGRAPPRSR